MENKLVEEMTADIIPIFEEEHSSKNLITAHNTAKKLVAKNYRKIPEGATILTRAELAALIKYAEETKEYPDEGSIAKTDKLVRDKIPRIIHAQGKGVCFRMLDDEEAKEYLERKLDEEVSEFHENPSLEELADIVEVVFALAKAHGHSLQALKKMQRTKRSERGGFERQICLIEVRESEGVE